MVLEKKWYLTEINFCLIEKGLLRARKIFFELGKYLFKISLHQEQTNFMRWHRSMGTKPLMTIIIHKTILFKTAQWFIDIIFTGADLS